MFKLGKLLGLFAAALLLAACQTASDYKVTHLDKARVYPGKTLMTDMSDRHRPQVVEVDFEGNIL